MDEQRPLPRSALSVPGSSSRMLTKAFASTADEVVIDLEDAVAVAAKDEAREQVVSFLRGLRTEKSVAVRVNAVGTTWCHQDLIALGSAASGTPLTSVIVPKVESPGDLAFVASFLDGIGIQALIESAAGLMNLPAIAASADGLQALILGYADLAASLGRSPATDHWMPAREHLLWAARAHGLRAVDGPHLGTGLDAAFASSVRTCAEAGFDTKWVIHPGQLDAVNAALSPSSEQIEEAHRILEALTEATRAGAGAVALDGLMLDEAVAVRARGVLERAGQNPGQKR